MHSLDRQFEDPRRVIDGLIILIGALAALAIGMVNAPPAGAANYDYIGVFGALSSSQRSADTNVVAGARLVDILEKSPDGETVAWHNPETGISYQIRVLTSFTTGTETCRTFTVRRNAAESVRESHRTACRQAKGIWKLNAIPVDASGHRRSVTPQ
jgi:surface antigen